MPRFIVLITMSNPYLNPISRLSSINKLIMHQDTNCMWSATFWYLIWCFL